MDEILRAAGVTDVYVCGIATDVCVGNLVVLFDMITGDFCTSLHMGMQQPQTKQTNI